METNPDFNRSSSDSQGKRADSPNSKNSKSERKDRERERSPRRGRSPRRSRSRSLSPENENQGDTLYVSGLSSRTTEAELESRFSKFGKILECQLIKDPRTGESRGFCFIKMEAAEAADQALFNLDKAEIDERTITVEKARRGKARSPTPGKYLGRSKRPPPPRGYGGYYGRYGGGYAPYGGAYGGYGGGYPPPPYGGGYGPYRGGPSSYPYPERRRSPYNRDRDRDRDRERRPDPYYRRERSRSRSRSPYYDRRSPY
mmetsp:Transcript_14536/g.20260  ORF Transcript_14536/g.20260 Transcript_14536/m.20260 type:complete len:258 (+) Transcript_14536:22-795(+)